MARLPAPEAPIPPSRKPSLTLRRPGWEDDLERGCFSFPTAVLQVLRGQEGARARAGTDRGAVRGGIAEWGRGERRDACRESRCVPLGLRVRRCQPSLGTQFYPANGWALAVILL